MWSVIITSIAGIFKDYMSERKITKQNKAEIEKAKVLHKIERIKNGDEHAMTMDLNDRKNAGWMDDFSFFVFMIPAILAFFPDMVPHVKAGFDALRTMPEWYQYALFGMLISIWGYRRLIIPIVEKFLEVKFKNINK